MCIIPSDRQVFQEKTGVKIMLSCSDGRIQSPYKHSVFDNTDLAILPDWPDKYDVRPGTWVDSRDFQPLICVGPEINKGWHIFKEDVDVEALKNFQLVKNYPTVKFCETQRRFIKCLQLWQVEFDDPITYGSYNSFNTHCSGVVAKKMRLKEQLHNL